MAPKDWELAPLGEMFDFKNGLNAEKARYGYGVKFVNVMDIFRNDRLFEDRIAGRVSINEKELDVYGLKFGDVLFNRTSETFDEIAMSAVYLDQKPAVFGGFVIRGRPKTNKIDPQYSVYLFQVSSFRKAAISKGQGAVRANIGQKELSKIRQLIPPVLEQQKIAKILSTWDEAIATTEQLLANSEQQKKALMQQLLTGKKRLPGFEGEWRVVKLKELLLEEKERNKAGSISRVLSVSNKYGFVLPESHFSKKVASDDLTNYKVVRKGQFGYNPSRLNVGSFARLDSYDHGVLSPMYVIFSVDDRKLNSDYFLAWMTSNEASQRISSSTQGTVRDSVGFDALCSLPFKLPPLQEQDAIANVLAACDSLITEYQASLDFLRDEKKALMQQLLTGKRRVIVEETGRATA